MGQITLDLIELQRHINSDDVLEFVKECFVKSHDLSNTVRLSRLKCVNKELYERVMARHHPKLHRWHMMFKECHKPITPTTLESLEIKEVYEYIIETIFTQEFINSEEAALERKPNAKKLANLAHTYWYHVLWTLGIFTRIHRNVGYDKLNDELDFLVEKLEDACREQMKNNKEVLQKLLDLKKTEDGTTPNVSDLYMVLLNRIPLLAKACVAI